MIDREKVIRHITAEISIAKTCKKDFASVDIDMLSDALALLKEQEAIPVDTKVVGASHGDTEVYCCRDCRTILDPAFHYCPNCGQAVKWE